MKEIRQLAENALAQLSQITQKDSDLTIQKECDHCKKEFEIKDTFLNRTYPRTCPLCEEEKRKSQAEYAVGRKQKEWDAFCPSLYRDTTLELLPNKLAVKSVLNWNYGPKGILLHGETRTGKSRSAWLLIQKLFFLGHTVEVLNATAGLQYAALFSQSASEVEKWLNRLLSCDLLLMDDVFKIKLTDSFEGIIFALVDGRIERCKPVIVTSNDTSETLLDRLSPDRGEPLLARLREFCTPITF